MKWVAELFPQPKSEKETPGIMKTCIKCPSQVPQPHALTCTLYMLKHNSLVSVPYFS